jgi:hypothetical protein
LGVNDAKYGLVSVSLNDLDLCDAGSLADLLLVNDKQLIDRLFRANDLSPPYVEWRPNLTMLGEEELRSLGRIWSDRRQTDAPPFMRNIDIDAVKAECDYAMALDVLGDGEDFYYQLYGERIAQVTGFDMKGKLLSSVPTKSALATFFLASYKAVVMSKSPLLTIHEPPSYAIRWTRLILPLTDDHGTVKRLLAGNIPHDRTPRLTVQSP